MVGVYLMKKCDKCGGEQFFTVYKLNEKAAIKCSKCGEEYPLKKSKKSKVDKIDNIEEVN